MDARSLISNARTAFAAQGVSFVCSVLMSLMVPKILGVAEYGYWQLFVFYNSYVSFFQLGLSDGVYLQHGGESRDRINRPLIKSEYLVGLSYQLLIAFAIVCYALLFESDRSRCIVLIASSCYLLISNSTNYFGYVLQSMNETKKFSYGSMIERVVFMVPLVACIALGVQDFYVYVVFSLFSRTISLAYTMWNVRDFLVAPAVSPHSAVRATWESVKLGFVLSLANLCGLLIVGIARFVIDAKWGIEAFGEVSFSLSIVNFALSFISQASMVLFPALRTSRKDQLAAYYRKIRDGLNVMLPFALLLYYPLRLLVAFWLPQYGPSLDYLIYLMPICVYGALADLEVSTFFNVRCEPLKKLLSNGLAVGLGCVLIAVSLFVFEDAQLIVMSAVVGVVARYLLGEAWLSSLYGDRNSRAVICCLLSTFAFVAFNAFLPMEGAFLATAASLGCMSFACRRELGGVMSVAKRLRSR